MSKKCVNVKEMHISGDYYEYKNALENLIIDLLQKFTKLKKVSVTCYSKKTLKVLRKLQNITELKVVIRYSNLQVPSVKDIARLVKGRRHLVIESKNFINLSIKDLTLIKYAVRITGLPSEQLILPYNPKMMLPGELLQFLVET